MELVRNTRRRWCILLLAILVAPAFSQERTEMDGFFSGTVADMSEEKVTVSRTVLGKAPENRTFVINSETKVEGKIKQKAG